MAQCLQSKNIIITGASGGIGERMAYLCAERGANLVLIARNIEKLQILQAELKRRFSGDFHIFQLDVSDTDKVATVFAQVQRVFKEVHVLVNNAGFGVFSYANEAEMAEVKAMFDVNVIGLISCTKMVLPQMLDQKHGHIINIASQAGKIATPKSSAYSATKHAVLGYTNSLRMELHKHRIKVTAVNPGPIETNFFNIADKEGTYVENVKKYMLDPEAVAKKVVDSMLTSTREINLPRWMNMGSIIFALFPRLFERVGSNVFNKK
ncbi:SDR family NAD(P)-dependent oxidoreductase [Cytobacillus purgationiresistens]|uniref:Short-subunit dehydrogenase n=1 Tax=Cytobacillus purgationiresistens TaxID=863449 RepID=A0ABU0ADM8_9BACI|nr:SDR family oxidoreductase [Cytobacillus purgationiresistens]MDQ0269350.1 short-subunit dehydrogenase [Cytobacillus purgationiresistens]